MLGSFKKWNIIQVINKKTADKDFDAVHKVVLYGISNNMSSLVHNGKYGAINTADPTTVGYYVVKFLSEPYMLQENKCFYKKVINACELIV